jgi:AmmeMemoRadiSam system protein B
MPGGAFFMPNKIPRIRKELSFQQFHQDGQEAILVQDNLGVLEQPLLLTEMAGMLLSLMDGRRSVEDIQKVFEEAVVGEVPPDFAARHIAEMENLGLLETPEILAREKRIIEDYLDLRERPASHADSAYVSEPELLRSWLEGVLGGNGEKVADPPPKMVIAPHIDFRVNTRVYAQAYRPLRGHSYDRVILMGTGHSILEGYFCPTRKDLVTPIGTTANDLEATDRLIAAGWKVVSPNDFPHRSEHALEFQMIFLQHLLGAGNFKVVPILCGSFHPLLAHLNRLGDEPGMGDFLGVLRDLIEEEGVRTLVVAGVDFSHIGTRFSHPVIAREMLEETRRHDRDLLEAFTGGEPERFWRTEAASGGKFNVCGFATLATLLEVMDTRGARTLAYDVWDDSPTGSAVTFAAVAG